MPMITSHCATAEYLATPWRCQAGMRSSNC